MAAGYLSLAYLAEISIVFNLAYTELKKGRYHKESEKDISRILLQVDNGQHAVGANFRELAEIFIQAQNLNSSSILERLAAWYEARTNNPSNRKKYYRYSAFAYPIYRKSLDLSISYCIIAITTLIVMICTYFDHIGMTPHDELYNGHISWKTFYFVLTCSILSPVFFIYTGRKMSRDLARIATYINDTFNQLTTNIILGTLTPTPPAPVAPAPVIPTSAEPEPDIPST